ncbi:unnamed protein product [Closterium sp. NIES-54]
MSYAKGNTSYAMQGDDGGRDLQTQSFRAHEHTDAHKAAVDWQLKLAVGIREGQQAIFDFINSDVEGRRAIRLMRSTQFLCQCDAPISMFPKLMPHLAEQDTPYIPRQSYGVEALAVKDAAESSEDLGMVDKVVRTVATLLGNSSVWSQRFKYLQRVIYQTNLEVQGIHTVRWLSRGDASATGDLTERYLKTNKPFGGEGKSWLLNFLKVHKEGGGKKVRVRGVDGEGRPINHLYTMHERKLKGHKQGSTYADCMKLCCQFARDCVDNLNERLDDLGKLGPTKLFRAGKWPKIKAQREKKCKEWLHGCSRLFRHKLPGFNLKAAERELPTFCAIMESHHEMESFAQGLNNFGSVDSKRRWPNLILLWQELSVLPLSTMECERGFSRLNIIKSWVRGALCNALLRELMQISLLKYEIEWPEALEVWRSMRRRRPVKSLKLAVAERERKGKQKEGEAVAAGTAGENEDEGE